MHGTNVKIKKNIYLLLLELAAVVAGNYIRVFLCILNSLLWKSKGGYTLVTLPHIVTPYRDSVDGTRDRVTYQTLVTR